MLEWLFPIPGQKPIHLNSRAIISQVNFAPATYKTQQNGSPKEAQYEYPLENDQRAAVRCDC